MISESTDLAVVIVSWNVRELLGDCLESLSLAMGKTGVQGPVWVIDNASTDGSVDLVRERYSWVHLVAQDRNLGYVRANNLALADLQTRARYIWLLNPDTVVNANALQRLIEFMETDTDAGLIGPKLLNVDGSVQESAFHFPGVIQALFALELMPQRLYYTILNGRYSSPRYAQQAPFPIDHPLGAAMMVRAQTVRDVGLLDEGFFMYCEEIDWAWRMKNAGWGRWLVPSAEITHVGGASTGQARPETTAHLWRSRARLYQKHRGRLVRTVVSTAVKHVFSERLADAPSPAWAQTYREILQAWSE
ncbi:MAG: glycosyltransferase family 2 protein [Anaerolineae bacterium]